VCCVYVARVIIANPLQVKAIAHDDLAGEFGRWPFVLCLEVVEHVYFPHRLAHTLFELCESDGIPIVSTPYHGYWKNLALSLVPGA
jgi:2-polyprenyl-3-methyl-5-hydroxy-6-metoxy-1,4-benzoquinol methylase